MPLFFYTKYIKYPRTWHHPISEGVTDDDKVLKDTSNFEGKEIVVTVKMDGENFMEHPMNKWMIWGVFPLFLG